MGCLLIGLVSVRAQNIKLENLRYYNIEILDSFEIKRPSGVDYINGYCKAGKDKIAFYFSEPSVLYLYDIKSGVIETDTLIFSDKIPRSANTPQLYSLREVSQHKLLFTFDQTDFMFINNCFYFYDLRKNTFSTTPFNFSSTFLKYYSNDSNMHMTPIKYSFRINDIGRNEIVYRGNLFVTVKNDYKPKFKGSPDSRPWLFKFSMTDTPRALNISLTDLHPEWIRKTPYTGDHLLMYYTGAQYFHQKGRTFITHAFSNRMAVMNGNDIETILSLTTNSIDIRSVFLPDTNSIDEDFYKYCSFEGIVKHRNLLLRPIHFPNTDAEGMKLLRNPRQYGYLVYDSKLEEKGFIAPNNSFTIIQSLGTHLLLNKWGDKGNGANKFYIGRLRSIGHMHKAFQYVPSPAINQKTPKPPFLSLLDNVNDTVFVIVTNKSCAPCNMKNKELLRELNSNPELIRNKILVAGYYSDSGYIINGIKINHPNIMYQYDDALNDSFNGVFSVGIIYRKEDNKLQYESIGTDRHEVIYNHLLRK